MNKVILTFFKIIFVLLIVAIVGVGFLAYKADSIIKAEVEEVLQNKINNNPKSVYEINLDGIRSKIWVGDVELEGISVRPKQEALDTLISVKRGIFEIKLKSLKLKGAKWYNVFFDGRTIITNNIIIESPEICYYLNKNGKKNSSQRDLDIENIIRKNKIALLFDNISLKHTQFTLYDITNDTSKTFSVRDFSFEVDKLKIDSNTIRTSDYICNFDDFTTGSGQARFHLNNNYNLTINDFFYNYKEDSLKIDDLNFNHQLTKEGYEKSFKDDSPYYKIKVGKIAIPLHEINPVKKNSHFEKIRIKNLDVFVFQSKKRGMRQPKRKPLLNEIFSKIPIPLFVREVDLDNCNFVYEFSEANEIEKNAVVTFNETDVNIKHFTTIPEIKDTSRFLKVHASTKFMNKGILQLDMSYDLLSKNESHEIVAKLSRFALPNLNNTIAAIAPIKIKNGIAHSAVVNYKANNNIAQGTLDLHYTDVWVELVKNEKKEKNYGIISFIGNSIIKKNNVPGTDKYKQGKISYEFNPNKSILNYMWNATKSGLLSSVSRSKKK